jgi:type VI secretion system protein ImpM
MSVVVHGKHPSYGDFLSYGLEKTAAKKLDDWGQTVLPLVRDTLGEEWESAWLNAPDLRFWIGADVLGMPLFGVWRASHDKVRRLYPFLFGLKGWVTSPPVRTAHDSIPFEVIERHLTQLEGIDPKNSGVQALIKDFELPEMTGSPFQARQNGTLWGRRDDVALSRLLLDAQDIDADSAQFGRSHWWHPATDTHDAGWLAVNGLPNSATLVWLLTGWTRAVPKIDPEVHSTPTQHIPPNIRD